jgi:hypothetical protein
MMKFRIAILAAGAGTLALAQTDLAQANYAGASAATGAVGSPEIESAPAANLAQNQWVGRAGKSGSFQRSTSGSFQRSTSGSFQRDTSGSFQRGTSGSFQRLPRNGKTRK